MIRRYFLSIAGVLTLSSSLLSVAAVAAEERSWHDRHFGQDWVLTARDDQFLVLYREYVDEAARRALETREDLSLIEPYSPESRSALYEGGAAVAERIARYPEIEGVTPAVRDAEGFTKYYLPGQLTVQLEPMLSDQECREILEGAGSTVLEDYWTPGYYRVSTPPGVDLFQAIRDWYVHSEVVFAEPYYISYDDVLHVPNDPFFPQQWPHRNTAQQPAWLVGADVQSVEAWDITRGDPNVLVVVIDTGMDLSHEDLAANLLPRNGADWDFADPSDGSPDDTGDHGTACSGIAVAVQDNGLGVSGVAPQCRIMPLRVNLSAGANANRADAINYAASRRAEFAGLVMSCSWRMSSGDFTAVQAAIQNGHAADCVMCFASGNENGPVVYPARYPETIAVGASSPCDERKSFTSCDGENFWGSCFGPELDVVAPGVKIYTTDRTGGSGYAAGNYFSTFNGTSSATPLAAGICALIYSVNPTLTNEGVRQILQSSAEDLVGTPIEDLPGFDNYMGWGRVNAYRAVQMAASQSFEDDMESGASAWSHLPESVNWLDPWHLSTQRNHTPDGQFSWRCGSESNEPYSPKIHASLVSPGVYLPADTKLIFWHAMDVEEFDEDLAADGGVVEISTDNGASWIAVTPETGYTHTWGSDTTVPFTEGTPVFSGQFDWTPVLVDLGAHAGEFVRVRFRFGSRRTFAPGEGGEGWFIDDVEIAPLDVAGISAGGRPTLSLALEPNQPNPFASSTRFQFHLDQEAPVNLQVADASGRRIWSLSLGSLAAGAHAVDWAGLDDRGRPLPAGVYFFKVDAGARTAQRRLVRLP